MEHAFFHFSRPFLPASPAGSRIRVLDQKIEIDTLAQMVIGSRVGEGSVFSLLIEKF